MNVSESIVEIGSRWRVYGRKERASGDLLGMPWRDMLDERCRQKLATGPRPDHALLERMSDG